MKLTESGRQRSALISASVEYNHGIRRTQTAKNKINHSTERECVGNWMAKIHQL